MLKLLIVDDDFMIADCLEEILVDAGYDVCGIAGCLADAVVIGREHQPDLAIIDLRLADGEYGTDVALALRRDRPLGVLYATGNPDHKLLDNGTDDGCIAKPYTGPTIVAALLLMEERMQNKPAPFSLPPGFRLLGG